MHDFIDETLLDNEPGLGEDEKNRILRNTLSKLPKKGNNFVPKKLFVACAAVMLLFVTYVGASEYFDWDMKLSNFLNINGIPSEDLVGAGTIIDVSQTIDGTTIKATQTLADDHTLYVLFDVIAKEGTVLNPNYMFEHMFVRLSNFSPMGYTYNYVEDDNPTDNQMSFILVLSSEKKLNKKTIQMDFSNFGYYPDDVNKPFETVSAGDWTLKWELDVENLSHHIRVNKNLDMLGSKYKLSSIEISPISLNIKINRSLFIFGNKTKMIKIDNEMAKPDFIKFHMADGSILTTEDLCNTSGRSSAFNKINLRYEFKNVLNLREVKNIQIGDIMVPVSK